MLSKVSWASIWILCLLFVACPTDNCDSPAGPTKPTPTTTTTVSITVKPPRVDQEFVFDGNVGFSLFAGARAEENEIRQVFSVAQARMGGAPFARVCGELQSWPNERPWLPRGVSARPFDETAPAYKELAHFLEVAATIQGAQVLLVPICNLKEDGTSPANREKWVRSVCALAAEYKNVAIEVSNEWKHPRSSITEREIIDLINACRAEAPYTLIGTDDNFTRDNITYNRRILSHVDYVSAHPYRNPDPTRREIRRMVAKNGPIVLSETTCYDGQRRKDGGLVTQDRNQILRYMNNCTSDEECVFTFHSLWGLGWPEMEIEWFPSAER